MAHKSRIASEDGSVDKKVTGPSWVPKLLLSVMSPLARKKLSALPQQTQALPSTAVSVSGVDSALPHKALTFEDVSPTDKAATKPLPPMPPPRNMPTPGSAAAATATAGSPGTATKVTPTFQGPSGGLFPTPMEPRVGASPSPATSASSEGGEGNPCAPAAATNGVCEAEAGPAINRRRRRRLFVASPPPAGAGAAQGDNTSRGSIEEAADDAVATIHANPGGGCFHTGLQALLQESQGEARPPSPSSSFSDDESDGDTSVVSMPTIVASPEVQPSMSTDVTVEEGLANLQATLAAPHPLTRTNADRDVVCTHLGDAGLHTHLHSPSHTVCCAPSSSAC